MLGVPISSPYAGDAKFSCPGPGLTPRVLPGPPIPPPPLPTNPSPFGCVLVGTPLVAVIPAWATELDADAPLICDSEGAICALPIMRPGVAAAWVGVFAADAVA